MSYDKFSEATPEGKIAREALKEFLVKDNKILSEKEISSFRVYNVNGQNQDIGYEYTQDDGVIVQIYQHTVNGNPGADKVKCEACDRAVQAAVVKFHDRTIDMQTELSNLKSRLEIIKAEAEIQAQNQKMHAESHKAQAQVLTDSANVSGEMYLKMHDPLKKDRNDEQEAMVKKGGMSLVGVVLTAACIAIAVAIASAGGPVGGILFMSLLAGAAGIGTIAAGKSALDSSARSNRIGQTLENLGKAPAQTAGLANIVEVAAAVEPLSAAAGDYVVHKMLKNALPPNHVRWGSSLNADLRNSQNRVDERTGLLRPDATPGRNENDSQSLSRTNSASALILN